VWLTNTRLEINRVLQVFGGVKTQRSPKLASKNLEERVCCCEKKRVAAGVEGFKRERGVKVRAPNSLESFNFHPPSK